jgi:hypothetical protein
VASSSELQFCLSCGSVIQFCLSCVSTSPNSGTPAVRCSGLPQWDARTCLNFQRDQSFDDTHKHVFSAYSVQ